MQELDIHAPGERLIPVPVGQELGAAIRHEQQRIAGITTEHSQLTAYFEFNMANRHNPLHLTYDRVYEKLRYEKKSGAPGQWKRYVDKKRKGKALCRIKGVSPGNLELLVISRIRAIIAYEKYIF